MLTSLAWCIWTLLIGKAWLLSTVVNLPMPTVPLSVFPTMGSHPKNDVPNTLTRREQHWRMKRKKFAAWNSRLTTWILDGFTIFDLLQKKLSMSKMQDFLFPSGPFTTWKGGRCTTCRSMPSQREFDVAVGIHFGVVVCKDYFTPFLLGFRTEPRLVFLPLWSPNHALIYKTPSLFTL